MRWQVEETVGEFGRYIGIEDLALSDEGAVALEIERIGRLGVEMVGEQDDRVAVTLSREYRAPFGEEALRYALESCHYRNARPHPVHPALASEGKLMFAVCLDSSELTAQQMHEIVDELDRMHESMTQVAVPVS